MTDIHKWVYLNDAFLPIEEAKISVLDRGFLFGDGVYESIPVYYKKIRDLSDHLDRLSNSMNKMHMCLENIKINWSAVINELVERNKHPHQSIYLQITRGSSSYRCHIFPNQVAPTVLLMSQPLALPNKEILKSGQKSITLEDIRWRYPCIKTINLLGNVLQLQRAVEKGVDDVVLTNDGCATEGACSNLFTVRNGVIITPPIQRQMLSGITRGIILKLSKQMNIPCREQAITLEELYTSDEVWLTNSIQGVVPMAYIDDKQIGNGRDWRVWEKIFDSYLQYIY